MTARAGCLIACCAPMAPRCSRRRVGLAVAGLEPRPLPSALMQLGLLPVGRVASHMTPLLTLPMASLACRLLEQDKGSCAALSITMMLAAGADATSQVMGEARAVLESPDATITATVLAIGSVWGLVLAGSGAVFLLALFLRGECSRAMADIRGYLRDVLRLPEGEGRGLRHTHLHARCCCARAKPLWRR